MSKQLIQIKILPRIAICRLGGASEPMDNFIVEPDDKSGFRRISPATTYEVDQSDGSILRAFIPSEVTFKDSSAPPLVRPIAPFLELWGQFEGEDVLRPLTIATLSSLGLTPGEVRWSVSVANLKMVRRTGDPNDAIEANLTSISDHQRNVLLGKCSNFKEGAKIPLGFVQYIRPTASFPEIRVRITPPSGLVYGHEADDVIPEERALYDSKKGSWPAHTDESPPKQPELPMARLPTEPATIYALFPPTRPGEEKNRGLFDDTWDGIVSAQICCPTKTGLLESSARVSVGPPDFAPDGYPVRTLYDDLEQILHGPDVEDVDPEQVIDIVRRSLETMQLIDTKFMNDRYNNRFPGGALWSRLRNRHRSLLQDVKGILAPEKTPERDRGISALALIVSVVRKYDDVWNDFLTSRQMPALMRGSDGGNLALTRRQRNTLVAAFEKYKGSGTTGPSTTRPTSFKLHILPCFSDEDVAVMKDFGLDLADVRQVSARSGEILGRLKGTTGATMPPKDHDGPWPEEWIAVFERWIKEGHPE